MSGENYLGPVDENKIAPEWREMLGLDGRCLVASE